MESLGALAILAGFGLVLASFGFVVWALIDASRYTGEQWRQSGQSKALWLAIIIAVAVIGCGGLGWIGALLYVVVARPALRRTRPAGSTWA